MDRLVTIKIKSSKDLISAPSSSYLVGGVALGMGLVAVSVATIGMRSGGREADNSKDDEDCRIHVVTPVVAYNVVLMNSSG